jgi:hypothetical protein
MEDLEPWLVRAENLLRFDPETGYFYWRQSRGGTARAGERAGGIDAYGYWVVKLEGKSYKAHRLAWAFIHRAWPAGDLGHKFGSRQDNRVAFLRPASRKANAENRRQPRAGNTSGFLGVSWSASKQKFAAQLASGGINKHLGYFVDPAEGHQVYLETKRVSHAACTL